MLSFILAVTLVPAEIELQVPPATLAPLCAGVYCIQEAGKRS